MKNWHIALITGITGAVALAVGLLIGHYAILKHGNAEQGHDSIGDIDESLIQHFMSEIDNKRIEDNLRELSEKPHMATTKGDIDLVKLMLDRWQNKETGLDEAKKVTYNVWLSFPQKDKPNSVTVVLPNGTELFKSQMKEKNYTKDQLDPDVVQPFAAYAPAGTPKGRLVYANYGTMDDYQHLNQTIDLKNTIAIVKYGGTGRGNKGINGAKFGVTGVIVYTDPADINDGKTSDKNETYPHSWYLPPSGVERGSYKLNFGDQLTPYYPAKDYTFRQAESDVKGLSPIPAQPIGFEDARQLICAQPKVPMAHIEPTGFEIPEQGREAQLREVGDQLGMNLQNDLEFGRDISRKNGGNHAERCNSRLCHWGHKQDSQKLTACCFDCSEVQVNVFNKREVKPSDNVIGVIRGSVEPDRYVIYGNHRDSWVHGAIDPSSGTAVMLEITRVMGKMVKEGKWRPRRSIIFGSWGAEEFGLIGSTEWTEEYYKKLIERTVGYINVDIAVFANATLRASGSPAVQSVVFDAAKQVSAPGHSDLSVYENWMKHSNRTSALHGLIPNLGSLGAGSDYAPFFHYLGISSMDIAYTYDKTKTKARIYPAYHTGYDTFDYASRFIDPGFTSHQTVGRTAGNVLMRLADSVILPLNIRDYSEAIDQLYNTAERDFAPELLRQNISLDPLHSAVKKLKEAAEGLHTRISELRDQQVRHVIYASKNSDVETFPGLADAYQRALANGNAWDDVRKHLTVVTYTLESAASTLEAVI
ncbi:aminopeptidase NAALADL1 [Chiloscyllium plagiosum]|uniref:aminopeptidase NAALADL1 n=1 Tax=Chiloscyllium plagiosum TaxID=36176 RepID=UPI001CB84833|nr:aminopeptidase NAALADL1 [Chiloscyllium plagiosum]